MTDGGTAADRPAADGEPASYGSNAGPGAGTPRRRRIILISAVAGAVLVADQVTKSLAVEHLSHRQIHLIGPFRLVLSYNTGVAFSIGSGLTLPIILIAAAVVGSIVWLSRGSLTTPAALAVGLILGGAIGNLADRLFRGHHGGVVDFFYSGFWPTFNVADACITIGSILLAVTLWRRKTL